MQSSTSDDAAHFTSSPSVSPKSALTRSTVLLLIMKAFSSALQYQMIGFNIEEYTTDPNKTNACTAVPFRPQGNVYTGDALMLLAAAGTVVLATLGGVLSDKYSMCLNLLSYGSTAAFWVSVVLPLLIELSILCQHHIYFVMLGGGLAIPKGFVDPLLIYGLMQNVNGPQSRRFLMFAYFIAAATAELLGSVPLLLRYLFRHSMSSQSFEFVGVIYSSLSILCLLGISGDHVAREKLRNHNFEFPTMRRLIKHNIIVAAFIPFSAVMIMCRNIFYWKEMQYYTKNPDGFINSILVLGTFHSGNLFVSACAIVLVMANKFPERLTFDLRIKSGLLLMMSSKLVLFVISFYHTEISHLGQSHPIAIQAIYLAASFTDGVANALATVAMYDLTDWIAVRCAKAICFGIFYTTWCVALFLTVIVIAILRQLPSEGSQLMPEGDAQPQFYMRYGIVIALLLLCYAHYSRLSFPLAEPLMLINLEEDRQNSELLSEAI